MTQKRLVVAGMIVCVVASAIVFVCVGSQMATGWNRQLATGAGEAPTEAGWVALLSSILGMLGFGWAATWVSLAAKYVGPVVNRLPPLPNMGDMQDADSRQPMNPQIATVLDTAEIALFLTLCQIVKDPKGKAELVKAARTQCDLWRDAQFPIVSVEVLP